MRLNKDHVIGRYVEVYLDDKKMTDACLEASEDDGYVIVIYRDVSGQRVLEPDIEKGALMYDGMQVLKLTGNVRIEFDLGEFKPLKIETKE